MDSVVTGLFYLSKVFDMVHDKLLLGEMEAMEIRGFANDWFASYFEKIHHIVVNFDANSGGSIEKHASSRALIKKGGGSAPGVGSGFNVVPSIINNFPTRVNSVKSVGIMTIVYTAAVK